MPNPVGDNDRKRKNRFTFSNNFSDNGQIDTSR